MLQLNRRVVVESSVSFDNTIKYIHRRTVAFLHHKIQRTKLSNPKEVL